MTQDSRPEHESLSYSEFYRGLRVWQHRSALRAGMVLFSPYSDETIRLVRPYGGTGYADDGGAWVVLRASSAFQVEAAFSNFELTRCPLWDASFGQL